MMIKKPLLSAAVKFLFFFFFIAFFLLELRRSFLNDFVHRHNAAGEKELKNRHKIFFVIGKQTTLAVDTHLFHQTLFLSSCEVSAHSVHCAESIKVSDERREKKSFSRQVKTREGES